MAAPTKATKKIFTAVVQLIAPSADLFVDGRKIMKNTNFIEIKD